MSPDAKFTKGLEEIYDHLEMLLETTVALIGAIAETHPEIASAYERHRRALDDAEHAATRDKFALLIHKLTRGES
jgi:hypothetical protein